MRAMCGVQFKDRKCANDWMLVLGMNETLEQLAMQTVCSFVWSCVEERG